jgi:UDP-4-amino-4,6-dideoxy-N-acetyl-beta-L-altrosamine transaminase
MTIPYGHQEITTADIDAVDEVLRSDYLTQGPVVPQFEEAVSKYCDAQHATAVNSATSALHLACLALGLEPGDSLWTSPITFVASANCGLYCGAKVDFVDIDSSTYNLSVEALEKKLIEAERQGNLPKIVVPVHLCGQPCDMKEIHALSQEYNFKIIEDAAHAIGGRYLGDPIGNCRYSDISIFSFHPVKIITTAEGGMALTNNYELAQSMSLLRSHGITRDAAEMTREPDGPWYYQQIELGFNYRMTDIQAALGLSQLQRLDDYVSRRHHLADRYDKSFAGLPLTVPRQDKDGYSAYHLYVVRLNSRGDIYRHKKVFECLREQGIGVNLHYIPVHTHPYYQKMGFKTGDFPNAESYYREVISLPLYPTMTEAQQDKVVAALKNTLQS